MAAMGSPQDDDVAGPSVQPHRGIGGPHHHAAAKDTDDTDSDGYTPHELKQLEVEKREEAFELCGNVRYTSRFMFGDDALGIELLLKERQKQRQDEHAVIAFLEGKGYSPAEYMPMVMEDPFEGASSRPLLVPSLMRFLVLHASCSKLPSFVPAAMRA